jgi:hypothetical protein
MTVILTSSVPQSYVGLAADTKPTAPRAGALFYETDTGLSSIYDGAAWQRQATSGGLYLARTSVTFTGAANLGAIGPVPWFTVTGAVLVEYLIGFCVLTPTSAGGGTLALGVTGSTALFIAATTATGLVTGDTWMSATPNATGLAVPAALKQIAVVANIIGTVATGAITAGTVQLECYWRPISATGLVA